MNKTKKIIALILASAQILSVSNNISKTNKDAILAEEQNKKIKAYKLEILEHYATEHEKEVNRINSVTYKRYDVTVLSDISYEEMESVLKNYKGAETMSHLSNSFVDAENYGVNAFFIAGIAALESSFATSRRAIEDNNLTGFEVYNDDSEGRLFDTQHDSIIYTAKLLSNQYLNKNGNYYNGFSVDAIQKNYCPEDSDIPKNWEDKVDKIASGLLDTYNRLYRENE